MWKFRKMFDDLPSQGPSLTLRYDFRMTRVGRFLERTKLDELPQLINLLQGDMSAIGPRPEVPKFVAHYPEEWGDVLSVKPGIFGANQLRNRNESELYPPGIEDVEGFYVSHILPDKLKIDADYARRAGWAQDLSLLVRCLFVATFGSVTGRTLQTMREQVLNFVALSTIGTVSMAAAFLLAAQPKQPLIALPVVLLAAVVKPVFLLALRVPKSLTVSVTAVDLLRLVQCAFRSATVIAIGMMIFSRQIHGLTLVLDTALFLSGLVLYKLALYAIHVTFAVQPTRILMRRMIVASLVLAPLSLGSLLAIRHGIGAGSGWHPAMLALALLIRPMLLALSLFPVRRGPRLIHPLALQSPMFWTSVTGSVLLAMASIAFGMRTIPLVDLLLDALIFHAVLTAFVFHQRAQLDRAPKLPASEERERIVIVGSGVELAAYVSALVALPEDRFEVLGIVTPGGQYRTRTIGGHAIIGELVELPEIIKTLKVQRLVVVPRGIDRASLAAVQKASSDAGCAILTVPLLSGLLGRPSINGHAEKNGRVKAGAHAKQPISRPRPVESVVASGSSARS